ncbi:hypothetical protein DR996_07430 [Vibrio owensii]|nr:hypothetical protein DR996_07430 [Vibrio owensii]
MFDLNSNRNNFKKYKDISSSLIFEYNTEACAPPTISITIPTFRRPDLLLEAVNSVAAQETKENFEIVIVDNDNTREFSNQITSGLNNLKINIRYYVNDQNIGMFGNWNRCIELAQAPLVSILNDDDFLQPNWLESVLAEKKHTQGYVKVKTKKFTYLEDIEFTTGNSEVSVRSLSLYDLFWGNINPGSLGILMDKSQAIEIGGFNETLYPTADYDFLCRITHRFGGVEIKKTLANYRMLVNESLKLETLEAFIDNDFEMRKSFFTSSKNKIKTKIMLIFIKISTLRSIKNYHKVNSNLNSNKLYERYNITRTTSILNKYAYPKKLFKALRLSKLI